MDPQYPDVDSYYVSTRFDYRSVWNRNRRDVAVHFGYYDENARHHVQALDNMNRAMADLADIKPGEHVLDAGCGFGNACFWLAENRKAQVTGINIVPSQIDECRKQAAIRRSALVEFIQADFCKMPFSENTFDVVWACESVCHAVIKERFYQEAFRVLKPGGRLVMAEYMRTDRPASHGNEQLLTAWLRPWAISDISTLSEHSIFSESSGFQRIELIDVTPNVRVSLRNLHDIAQRWLPIGKFLNKLGWVNDVRLSNAVASVRQYEALQANAWAYVMLRAEKLV